MLTLVLFASLATSAYAGMCAEGTPAFVSGVVVTRDGTATIATKYDKDAPMKLTDLSVNFLTNDAPYLYWVGVDNQVFDTKDIIGSWTVTSWTPLGLSKPYGQEVFVASEAPISLDAANVARLVAVAESIRRTDKMAKNGPCFSRVEDGLWAMTFNSSSR